MADEETTETTDQGGGIETKEAGKGIKEKEGATEKGVGGRGEATTSIMRSPTMEWFFDPAAGRWYVSYQLPNSDRRIFYEASADQMDAIFGEGQRPVDFRRRSFEQVSKRQTFAGDISEVEGTGRFEREVKDVIALALDEGRLPDWARGDKQVHDLLYIAVAEEKSDEWLVEQISKLDSFKARFPGINKLKQTGLTTIESVGAFLEFETGVKKLLTRQGRNPKSLDPSLVGRMLAKGHSLEDVQFVFDGFENMRKNKPALDAFNEVLAARGMDPLKPKDQLEFLAGKAPSKLYDIWEEASFNRAAQQAGLDISVKDAMKLARRTYGNSTYDQALEGLSTAAQNILRFRSDIDLNRYNIDAEDLIDLSLGLAPRSGRSQAEVGRNVERALAAARAGLDGPRANRFRRFSDEGVPEGVSTSRARTRA
jgi:hypothetical protein